MKIIKYILLLLLLVVSLDVSAASEKALDFEAYRLKMERRIADISDYLAAKVIYILLDDGTLWECHYEYLEERNLVWQKWKRGDVIGFNSYYRLYNVTHNNIPYGLQTYLDFHSIDALPVIVSKTEEGHIKLSDGSEWEENSFSFWTAHDFWSVGEKIFVFHCNENEYYLQNLDRSNDYTYNVTYMYANLVALEIQP